MTNAERCRQRAMKLKANGLCRRCAIVSIANGAQHRKEIGGRTRDLRLWLKRHNFPPGFRILCFNCNSGRHLNGGICPHLTKIDFQPFTFIA
jgi:hypothetical protein